MLHRRPKVEYSDGQFQFKVPFIMYADFESILKPIQGRGNDPRMGLRSGLEGPNGAPVLTTRGINVHIPSGWCILSELAYREVKDPLKLYRGKDCI